MKDDQGTMAERERERERSNLVCCKTTTTLDETRLTAIFHDNPESQYQNISIPYFITLRAKLRRSVL